MAFQRPTLAEIAAGIENEVASRLGLGGLLPRSVLKVLSRVLAGAVYMLHGHVVWSSRQVVPSTAEQEYLEQWAELFGITRKPATYSAGSVTVSGTDGSVLPKGSLFRRADGWEYQTTLAATIVSGTASVPVLATIAGGAGDAEAATALTLGQSVVGVNSSAVVASGGLTGGADEETDTSLRERLTARVQKPPQGGSAADYERWALEVPEVTRAWALGENSGPGTVDVAFVLDDDAVSIVPSALKEAEVTAYIDERRPVATAGSLAFGPLLKALDPSIQLVPNTPQVQSNVSAALNDMLLRETAPGKTITLSKIRQAISNAPGEVDHLLVAPVADVTTAAGEIVVLGTPTWS